MASEADGKGPDKLATAEHIGDDEDRENSTDSGSDDAAEEEEEEDEPKLKYMTLTKSLGPIYRNGDATSAFLVAGDKMVWGMIAQFGGVLTTQLGAYANVRRSSAHILATLCVLHSKYLYWKQDADKVQHVLSLPSLESIRVYRAHSASITAVSISPFPPPLPAAKSNAVDRITQQHQRSPAQSLAASSSASPSSRSPKPAPAATASNAIHIATSSLDGNVCVTSLIDSKDVILRNFARPVQAVGLSPDYKSDRSYLSGGLAGKLILTVGGRSGTSSTSSTTGSPAASASGWLGSIGLGTNTGKDTILHSGEGAISTIKWSLSGKFVVWVNEHGIKIMRSNLHIESAEHDSGWKRISHVDRPNRPGWDEMAGVWKARAEWVDESSLETDADPIHTALASNGELAKTSKSADGRDAAGKKSKASQMEKLVVGWGGTVWIIGVHPEGSGTGKEIGERKVARSEVISMWVSTYTGHLSWILTTVQVTNRLYYIWLDALYPIFAFGSCLYHTGRCG